MAKDNTLLLIGGAAALGYAWYKGYLAQFGIPGPSSAPAAPKQTGGGSTGGAPAGPPPVPPLGTPVTSAADALRQAAANDAYILPDAATFAVLQSAAPSGYGWITTTDKGGVLLRPDVYSEVQKVISNRVKRAANQGAAASSIQQAGNVTLTEIQQMMTTAGLSGFGDYQRHIATRTGAYRPVRFVA